MAPDYHTREHNEYQEESLTSRPQPQHHHHHHRQASSSCFSSILTPNHVLHSSVEEQGGCFWRASHPSDRGLEALPAPIGVATSQKLQDHRVNENHQKGSHEHGSSSSSSSLPPFRWTSSKMRMMRKMIISEKRPTHNKSSAHKSEDPSYPDSITSSCPQMVTNGGCSDNNTVRVCVDCNTSRTPLWRSGPRGPKTLCNACGIRQRKARRALAATTANGAIVPPPAMTLPAKCKLKNKDSKRPGSQASIDQESETIKKRLKLPSPTSVSRRETKKLCLEDFAARLSKRYSANLQRVFPQEEKEAAILLMALSCGHVHG